LIPDPRKIRRCPRGVAVVSFVAALLVIGTMVVWLLQVTAATNATYLAHYYGTCALFAAESGVEMALRELNVTPPTDIDSDGTIGSISDNGNAADDPQITQGVFTVRKVSDSPPTYRATGRPTSTASPFNTFRRTLEVQTQ
jgi:hypothetical protein